MARHLRTPEERDLDRARSEWGSGVGPEPRGGDTLVLVLLLLASIAIVALAMLGVMSLIPPAEGETVRSNPSSVAGTHAVSIEEVS